MPTNENLKQLIRAIQKDTKKLETQDLNDQSTRTQLAETAVNYILRYSQYLEQHILPQVEHNESQKERYENCYNAIMNASLVKNQEGCKEISLFPLKNALCIFHTVINCYRWPAEIHTQHKELSTFKRIIESFYRTAHVKALKTNDIPTPSMSHSSHAPV